MEDYIRWLKTSIFDIWYFRYTYARARGYPPGYTSSNHQWNVAYSYGAPIVEGAYPWEDRNQIDRGGIREAVRRPLPGGQRTPGGFQGLQHHLGNPDNYDHDVVRPGGGPFLGRPRNFPH